MRRLSACIFLLAAILGVSLFFARYGYIMFPDEGFYLMAAKAVAEGKLLYRDHLYFQSPLLPYAYLPVVTLFPGKFVAGRYYSSLLTVLLAVVLAVVARRQRPGGGTCLLLLLFPSFQTLQYFSMPVAYGALSTLLASVAMALPLLTTRGWVGVASGMVLALAVGVRLPFLTLAVVPLGVLILKRQESEGSWTPVVGYVVAFLVGMAAIFGPFLVADPAATIFNNWTAHQLRSKEIPLWWDQTALSRIGNVIGVLFVTMWWNLPVVLLAVAWARRFGWKSPALRAKLPGWTFLAAAVVHGATHVLPKPTWLLYYCTTVTFLLVPAADALAGLFERLRGRRFGRVGVILLVSFIWGWNGFVGVRLGNGLGLRHAFALTDMDRPHVDRVEELAACLREHTPEGSTIFTYMLPIAYEADRDVPPGAEMSLFAFFPRWKTEDCRRHGLYNHEMLLSWLRSQSVSAVVATRYWNDALLGERVRLRNLDVTRDRFYKPIDCGTQVQTFPAMMYVPRRQVGRPPRGHGPRGSRGARPPREDAGGSHLRSRRDLR